MSRGLLALGACLALALGGCGGGSDSASTSSESTPATSAVQPLPQSSAAKGKAHESAKQDKGNSNGSAAKGANKDNSPSAKQPKPVKPPPISSRPVAGSRAPAPGVKTVSGGDNSVQEYGVEADESARREASIVLATYLSARAEGNWIGACSLLAKKPMEQLERLQAAAAKQGTELNGCAATMALLREGEARSLQQAQITEVLSFRGEGEISGDPSYLIFKGPPGQTLFSMPMYLQGGSWKVGLARAAELPLG